MNLNKDREQTSFQTKEIEAEASFVLSFMKKNLAYSLLIDEKNGKFVKCAISNCAGTCISEDRKQKNVQILR